MPSIPSPSRARSDRYRGNRDYFRQSKGAQAWKGVLSLAALGVSCLWFAWGFLHSPSILGIGSSAESNDGRFSHGPLANPHSGFDNRCDFCHKSSSISQISVGNLLDVHQRWHSFDCSSCHKGPDEKRQSYSPHNAIVLAKDASSENCSNCHHDHAGQDASLVRMPDDSCVRCHADLKGYYPATAFAAAVPDFLGHPKFRILNEGSHKRQMKFSHIYHMKPGILKNGKPVNLNCNDCHRLDSGRAYYLPVKFEANCSECHAQKFTPSDGVRTLPVIDVPHGKQPKELRGFLEGLITERVLKSLNKPIELPPKIGERLDSKSKEALDSVNAQIERSKSKLDVALFNGSCAKCHDLKEGEIQETNSPAIWLTHAKFSHVAHKTRDCFSCHADKSARGSLENSILVEKENIAIPNVESCQVCHGPPRRKEYPEFGSARFDCVYCHRYHHESNPTTTNGIKNP